MQALPFELVSVIAAFSPRFSDRVSAHVQLLLAGAVVTARRRPGAAVFRVVGRGDDPHNSRDPGTRKGGDVDG
jgi:hypothetical protein